MLTMSCIFFRSFALLQVVLFFEELGLDKESVGKMLGRCPEIFAAKIDETLTRKLEFLNSFGLSKHLLPRVIKKYPEIFVSNIDNTIAPRLVSSAKTLSVLYCPNLI